MTVKTSDMSPDFAAALRAAAAADARSLSRKSRHELAVIERAELAAAGIIRVMGGPVSKDELVSAIINRRYPIERQNEATHVLYHEPGEVGSSACEWCACQEMRTVPSTMLPGYDQLVQCAGQPGHDGDHDWPQS